MPITGISHVAYRCASAAKTVEFYSGVLGMPYRYAIAENKVPSTGEHFPHIICGPAWVRSITVRRTR